MAELKAVEGPRRYVDPNALLEKQIANLMALIKDPPENSRVITYSPELSRWILENKNDRNRKNRPARIKRYAEMMGLDDIGWVLSGDTVKFSEGGRLLDGQNRFSASVQSQQPFRTHTVFGIADDAFDVIDAGMTRTTGDTLHVAGVADSKIVTKAVRWIEILTSDNPEDRGRTFSNHEMLQMWKDKNQARLVEAVAWAKKAPPQIPRGNLAACLYLFDEKSHKKAEAFAKDLGNMRRAGLSLAKKLKQLSRERAGRVHENQRNALIIQAWNVFVAPGNRTGAVPGGKLNWNNDRDFPVIAG